MTRCADGLCAEPDLTVAAETAATRAAEALPGASADLACVFVSGADPEECGAALERAAAVGGARVTLGCSAGGVMGEGQTVEAASAVSVWMASLPGAVLRTFHLEVMASEESLSVVGLPTMDCPSASSMLLLADVFSFPGEEFLRHVDHQLRGVPIVGTLAAGQRGAASTRLLVDEKVHDRGAVGVLLDDRADVVAFISQGARPIGPPMTVTAASGTSLGGLAGLDAVDKLAGLLADLPPEEQALASAGLHLGIAADEYVEDHDAATFVVRPLVSTDGDALLCTNPVEVGQTVRFYVEDSQWASTRLARDLRDARDSMSGRETCSGALVFSSLSRGAGFFGTADHDLHAVRAGLVTGSAAGCLGAGEIGPSSGRSRLHGFAASVLAFP